MQTKANMIETAAMEVVGKMAAGVGLQAAITAVLKSSRFASVRSMIAGDREAFGEFAVDLMG